jgi:cold shock CspA family protein
MKSQIHKGTLLKWKDDKGFGFIKSETEEKEIFIHISSLPKESRRPQIGDTIIYELKIENNGKLCAKSASIEGVLVKPLTNKFNNRRLGKNNLFPKFIPLIILLIFASIIQQLTSKFQETATYTKNIESVSRPDCNIKGNISQNTGKKYYHLPGMEDYESTVIDISSGEKWFCSEQEAISSGWVKAPN